MSFFDEFFGRKREELAPPEAPVAVPSAAPQLPRSVPGAPVPLPPAEMPVQPLQIPGQRGPGPLIPRTSEEIAALSEAQDLQLKATLAGLREKQMADQAAMDQQHEAELAAMAETYARSHEGGLAERAGQLAGFGGELVERYMPDIPVVKPALRTAATMAGWAMPVLGQIGGAGEIIRGAETGSARRIAGGVLGMLPSVGTLAKVVGPATAGVLKTAETAGILGMLGVGTTEGAISDYEKRIAAGEGMASAMLKSGLQGVVNAAAGLMAAKGVSRGFDVATQPSARPARVMEVTQPHTGVTRAGSIADATTRAAEARGLTPELREGVVPGSMQDWALRQEETLASQEGRRNAPREELAPPVTKWQPAEAQPERIETMRTERKAGLAAEVEKARETLVEYQRALKQAMPKTGAKIVTEGPQETFTAELRPREEQVTTAGGPMTTRAQTRVGLAKEGEATTTAGAPVVARERLAPEKGEAVQEAIDKALVERGQAGVDALRERGDIEGAKAVETEIAAARARMEKPQEIPPEMAAEELRTKEAARRAESERPVTAADVTAELREKVAKKTAKKVAPAVAKPPAPELTPEVEAAAMRGEAIEARIPFERGAQKLRESGIEQLRKAGKTEAEIQSYLKGKATRAAPLKKKTSLAETFRALPRDEQDAAIRNIDEKIETAKTPGVRTKLENQRAIMVIAQRQGLPTERRASPEAAAMMGELRMAQERALKEKGAPSEAIATSSREATGAGAVKAELPPEKESVPVSPKGLSPGLSMEILGEGELREKAPPKPVKPAEVRAPLPEGSSLTERKANWRTRALDFTVEQVKRMPGATRAAGYLAGLKKGIEDKYHRVMGSGELASQLEHETGKAVTEMKNRIQTLVDKHLAKMSPKDREQVMDIFDETRDISSVPAQSRQAVQESVKAMNEMLMDMHKEGMVDEKFVNEHVGKHIYHRTREFDEKTLIAAVGRWQHRRRLGAEAGTLKQQKHPTLAAMEEATGLRGIHDFAYSVTKGLTEQSWDVAKVKALRKTLVETGLGKKPVDEAEMHDLSDKGWSYLPGDRTNVAYTTRYGDVGLHMFPKNVIDDVSSILAPPTSAILKVMRALANAVKMGYIALSPAQHARQITSNLLQMADNLDVQWSSLSDLRTVKQALGDALAGKGAWKEMNEHTKIPSGSYAEQFMRDLYDAKTPEEFMVSLTKHKRAGSIVKKTLHDASALYGAEDTVIKYLGYAKQRAMGKSIEDAEKFMEAYAPAYHKISPAIRRWENNPLGASFLAFKAETIRNTWNLMWTPRGSLKILKRLALKNAALAYGLSRSFPDESEEDRWKHWTRYKVAFRYGENVIPVGRDERGRVMPLDIGSIFPDLEYTAPLAALAVGRGEDAERELLKQGSNWVLGSVIAQPIYETFTDEDWWTGLPIYGEYATPREKVQKGILHVARAWAPTVGQEFQRYGNLQEAAKGKPGRKPKPELAPTRTYLTERLLGVPMRLPRGEQTLRKKEKRIEQEKKWIEGLE
jgi:hypothetical protein